MGQKIKNSRKEVAADILVVDAYALIESESTWEKTTRARIHFTAMRNLIMPFVKSYPYDATFPHSRSRPVERSFSKATRTSSGTQHSRISRAGREMSIYCSSIIRFLNNITPKTKPHTTSQWPALSLKCHRLPPFEVLRGADFFFGLDIDSARALAMTRFTPSMTGARVL